MSHNKVRAYLISTGAVLLIAAGAANSQTEVITQGSATVSGNQANPPSNYGAFTVGNVTWTIQGDVDLFFPFVSDQGGAPFQWGGSGGPNSDISMSYQPYPGGPVYDGMINGVPSGMFSFDGSVPVTHAGTYTEPFTAQFQFVCSPCGNTPQIFVAAAGSGSFTSTWAYDPNVAPPYPYYLTGIARYTFQAPEPSTTALLLISLAGFGLQAWARTRREQRAN